MKMIKKQPRGAAILNFFVPGLGYIYLGKKKIFASLLIAIIILAAIDRYFLNVTASKSYTLLGVIISLMFSSAFAYDGYCEAKSLNEETLGRIKKFPTSKK